MHRVYDSSLFSLFSDSSASLHSLPKRERINYSSFNFFVLETKYSRNLVVRTPHLSNNRFSLPSFYPSRFVTSGATTRNKKNLIRSILYTSLSLSSLSLLHVSNLTSRQRGCLSLEGNCKDWNMQGSTVSRNRAHVEIRATDRSVDN